MAAVIGALRVVLGIDTAAFHDGLKQAQSRLAAAGKSMQSAGQAMTARVTAPIAAAAAAIGLGVSRVAGNLSDLGNQAKLANTDIQTFQKWAYGAKTVGIEQGKLSDILKDVNDKVGDYLATGGGEMKSFFDNIAPKVGITAEAFRDLSGTDALQLFVTSLEKAGVSQAEMVFYLESIGDEASGLIPLLADSGAEMTKQGEAAAEFGLATEKGVASAKAFEAAMQRLNRAMSALGNAIAEAGVLDFLTAIAERVSNWVAALNQANPQLTKFVLIGGAIAAAIGPALVVLGLAVTAIGAISAPVLLAVAAVGLLAGAGVALYANWDKLKAQFPTLTGIVENVGSALGTLAGGLLQSFKLMVQGVEQLFSGDFSGAMETAKAILVNFGETLAGVFENLGITGLVQKIPEAFLSVTNALGPLGDGIRAQVEGMIEHFRLMVQSIQQLLSGDLVGVLRTGGEMIENFGRTIADTLLALIGTLPEKFATMGRDIMAGLERGITERWETFKDWFAGLVNSIPKVARDILGIQSPSTVFAEIGGHIMQGLRQGLGAETAGIKAEMEGFANDLGGLFAGLLFKGQNLGDGLRGILEQSLGNWGGGLLNSGFGGLAGALKIPGFAGGTNFAPGGLAMVGERGRELVNLPRGSQVFPHAETMAMLRGGRAEPQAIRVYVDDDDKLRAMVDRRAGQQVEARRGQIVGESVQAVRQGNAMSARFMGRR